MASEYENFTQELKQLEDILTNIKNGYQLTEQDMNNAIEIYKNINAEDNSPKFSLKFRALLDILNHGQFYQSCFNNLKDTFSDMDSITFKIAVKQMLGGGWGHYNRFNHYLFELILHILDPAHAFLYAYAYGLTRQLYDRLLQLDVNLLDNVKKFQQNYITLETYKPYGIFGIGSNWLIDIRNTDGLEIFLKDGLITVDDIINFMFSDKEDGINYIHDRAFIQKLIVDFLIENKLIDSTKNLNHRFTDYVKKNLKSDTQGLNIEFFKIFYEDDPDDAIDYVAYKRGIDFNFIQQLSNVGLLKDILSNEYSLHNFVYNYRAVNPILPDWKSCYDLMFNEIDETERKSFATLLFNKLSFLRKYNMETLDDKQLLEQLIEIAKYLVDRGADIYVMSITRYDIGNNVYVNLPLIHGIRLEYPDMADQIEKYRYSLEQPV